MQKILRPLFFRTRCIKATRLMISVNRRCTKWKITNFSSSTPVRRLLCTKPPQKFVQKLQYTGAIFVRSYRPTFIQSRTVSSDSHNKHTSSVPSAKRTLRWIGHSRCQQKSRTDCWHNVNQCRHYFRNVQRHNTSKMQICRLQPPDSCLSTRLSLPACRTLEVIGARLITASGPVIILNIYRPGSERPSSLFVVWGKSAG